MSIANDLKNKAYAISSNDYEPVIRRQAVVSDVHRATATCAVLIGGSFRPVPGVKWLDSYYPVVGDCVWVDVKGVDMMIVGTVQDAGWTLYTAPTVGLSPGTHKSRYKRKGRTCHFNFSFMWSGTSGTGVVYAVQMPFYCTEAIEETIGSMKYLHSDGAHRPGVCYVPANQPFLFFVGSGGIVSGNFGLGYTPNAGARISASITYEVKFDD